MRGVVLRGDRRVDVQRFPDPAPGPDEVVLAMKASGICGSDLRPFRDAPRSRGPGATPVISGHEPCGEIVAAGAHVSAWRPGDRVIMHHYAGCGWCRYCRVGYAQLCLEGHRTFGFTANGGNADFLLAPASTMVRLPDELSYVEGAAVACGTGTAYSALTRLDVSGRDTLAVFGQGPVGLSATMLGARMGARVIAVDVSPERLELARRHGASETVDASAQDAVRAVLDLTGGQGADATLDATGVPEARVNAVRCARVFGRACLVGEGNTTTFDVSPQIIHKQLTIYGSWTFSTVGMADCARFVVERGVPLRELITDTFPLDRAQQAFDYFAGGSSGKCMFVWD